MAAILSWLDGDEAQRRRMLEIADLFKDRGAMDELGYRTTVAAVSDALFPATSTLHTRARYLLFVPWLARGAALRKDYSTKSPRDAMVSLNVSLIDVLTRTIGPDAPEEARTGIIGEQARHALKRLPGDVYSTAFDLLRIRTARRRSVEALIDASRRRKAVAQAEPTGEGATYVDDGWDPELPPAPTDFPWVPDGVTFDLTAREADYLAGRYGTLPPLPAGAGVVSQSLTQWLINHRDCDTQGAQAMWSPELIKGAPDDIRTLVDDARRFALLVQLGQLAYNAELARLQDPLSAQPARDRLEQEIAAVADDAALAGWDYGAFADRVRRLNPRIPEATYAFFADWLEITTTWRTASDRMPDLLRTRERALKGTRARLSFPEARAANPEPVGVFIQGYRWPNARSFLDDIRTGLERADV